MPFESRPADKFGKGEVNMGHLLHSALRLRPDRIVVGEVRGGEAFDLMQCMNTGHGGSMATDPRQHAHRHPAPPRVALSAERHRAAAWWPCARRWQRHQRGHLLRAPPGRLAQDHRHRRGVAAQREGRLPHPGHLRLHADAQGRGGQDPRLPLAHRRAAALPGPPPRLRLHRHDRGVLRPGDLRRAAAAHLPRRCDADALGEEAQAPRARRGGQRRAERAVGRGPAQEGQGDREQGSRGGRQEGRRRAQAASRGAQARARARAPRRAARASPGGPGRDQALAAAERRQDERALRRRGHLVADRRAPHPHAGPEQRRQSAALALAEHGTAESGCAATEPGGPPGQQDRRIRSRSPAS